MSVLERKKSLFKLAKLATTPQGALMAIINRTVTLETTHNEIEIRTKDSNKVDIVVKEKCDEENNYEVGNEATIRIRTYELDDLIQALEQFKD
jgi:hypothetical protein